MKTLIKRRAFSSVNNRDSQLHDIIQNYISVKSTPSRLKLLLEYSFGALKDPTRGEYVSAVGDLSSQQALKQIQRKMMVNPIGRQILEEKPRVTSQTWNQEKFLALPHNTFAYQYALWMRKETFSADERPVVKYIPDLELAYIIQRYREIHDALHVLLGYDIEVSEEIAVKWFEMIQLGLPSTALSAFFGPLNLLLFKRDLSQTEKLVTEYLPHIIQQAQNSTFFMNIYFEKYFEMDIVLIPYVIYMSLQDELRYLMRIRPIRKSLNKESVAQHQQMI